EGAVLPGEIGLLPAGLDPAEIADLPTAGERDGVVLLEHPPQTAGPWSALDRPATASRSEEEDLPERLAPFLPPKVAERIADHGETLLDEHRPVTVLFIGVGDRPIRDDPSAIATIGTVMDEVERAGGATITVGSGDKGTTVLAAFGAPVSFAGQRSVAAITAAAITERTPTRVGVATGLAFAGRVGADRRWNYNLIGDVVNRSARLMALADPGQVLADEPTFHGADPRIRWAPPTTATLKGRLDVTDLAALEAVLPAEDGRSDLPLTGRDAELETIGTALADTVLSSQGTSILLVGISGVGKTRLSRAVADRAVEAGHAVLTLDLANRTSGRNHGPWIGVLLAALDLGPDAGPTELEAAVRDRLGSEPTARLIRELVFDGVASSTVAGLDRRAAAEVVDDALSEVLAAAITDPTVLIADDAHDHDEASTRLLVRMLRVATRTPLTIVAATHPTTDVPTWPWGRIVAVDELTTDAAREVLVDHARKAGIDLPDDLIATIIERVGGNPQLLRLLADLDPDDQDRLPDDARAIVLGRFDRLPTDLRGALAMAASLGRHLDRGDFLGAFGGPEGRAVLDRLVAERLLEPTGPTTLSFASPILQEVAYESTAHASRAGFHHDVGLHLERQAESTGTERVEDLAHHFGYTTDGDRHRRYFAPAARRAMASFANQRAIHWFRRAIEVADGTELGPLRFDLGATIEHVGDRSGAAAEYEAATVDEAIAPRALASLALLQASTAGYEAACATADDALAKAEALADAGAVEWVLERVSVLHTDAGEFQRAQDTAARQLQVAEALDDQTRVASALANRGAAMSWLGELDAAARDLDRALGLCLDNGALAMAAEVEIDLGMVALDRGETDSCLAHLRRASARAAEVGYRRGEAACLSNRALALLSSGREDEALEPATVSFRLLVEVGDVLAAAAQLGLLAMLQLSDGRPLAAVGFLARVLEIGARTGTTTYRERAYDVLIDAHRALEDEPAADRAAELQSRARGEVEQAERAEVAPMLAPDSLGLDDELTHLLVEADRLIDGLG
ncbi:MAG: AAA family ATPase, partial [Actinomycetota bacterium]